MAYLITEQAAASVHTLAALVAYTWQEHRPLLHLTQEDCDLLANAFERFQRTGVKQKGAAHDEPPLLLTSYVR